MTSPKHLAHIRAFVSHNNCDECRADTERRFVPTAPWKYDHVNAYLAHVKPRLAAINNGYTSVEATIWYRKFRRALHTRISLKSVSPVATRKAAGSYIERLQGVGHVKNAAYLKRFAQRGASCLEAA